MRIIKDRAFTIVEVVIVITIVAILSSIAVITYTSIRQDSRDATRQGNVTVISEALEKYYERHGEYPSVASITNNQPTNTGPVVASKLSIPAESLVMPNTPSTTTNALTADPNPNGDYIVYEAQSADNPLQCQSDVNGGCDEFTLRYMEESSGDIKELDSRRSSRITAPTPTLEVSTLSISSISASWTPVTDAIGYELQYSTSPTLYSPTSITTESPTVTATATGLVADTEYYFRVRATLPGYSSNWSDIQSDITSSIELPAGTINVYAAMNGTSARGSTDGGTCPSGTTIERQIRYQVNTGSWQAYVTGTPRDIAATEGYRYTFQAHARCKNTTSSGPWKASTTAAVVRPATAPSGLTISANMNSTYARGTASGGSCASGTSLQRQMQYYVNAGSWSGWSTRSVWDISATSGYRYTFRQQARCAGTYSSSAWVLSGTDYIVRPVAAPSGLTISASIVSTSYARGSGGGGTCPAGTSMQRQIRYSGRNDTAVSYVAWSTRSVWDVAANQGWRYVFQQQARCVGSYASSGFVASSTASIVRTITTKPTGGSASASTSGSYTTFTMNSVSGCPTGTTVLYTYRYIYSTGNTYPPSWDISSPYYNNPPHNWSSQLPASTAYRTFQWYTAYRNRNYHVHFAAMCATTHHTGPWMDSKLAHATSYYRP